MIWIAIVLLAASVWAVRFGPLALPFCVVGGLISIGILLGQLLAGMH